MRIIPYLKREYKSSFSREELRERLKKTVSGFNWNLTIEKISQNQIQEGIMPDYSFLIVRGKYVLTYGKNSLLPIMKGELLHDKKDQKTIVKIVIRPFKSGMFILAPFYCIAIYGMIQAFIRGDLKLLIFCFVFIGVTYGSLITNYNKEADRYIELLKNIIL